MNPVRFDENGSGITGGRLHRRLAMASPASAMKASRLCRRHANLLRRRQLETSATAVEEAAATMEEAANAVEPSSTPRTGVETIPAARASSE